MNILKYFIVFFLFSNFSSGFAQNSKLSITSNSGKFFLFVNNIIQNENPTDSIHLNSFDEGSYTVKIINTDSISSVEKNIYLTNCQSSCWRQRIKFLPLWKGFPPVQMIIWPSLFQRMNYLQEWKLKSICPTFISLCLVLSQTVSWNFWEKKT